MYAEPKAPGGERHGFLRMLAQQDEIRAIPRPEAQRRGALPRGPGDSIAKAQRDPRFEAATAEAAVT
jgi:hypothetical protein